MTGTILNIATVIVGSCLGILVGARLPDRIRQTVMAGLGLFTASIGIKMVFSTGNSIIVLGSLLLGGLLGEWWRIEDVLRNLGAWLENATQRLTNRETTRVEALESRTTDQVVQADNRSTRFVRGFLTASLVFCIGPMTILGSIQDGLSGDYNLLAIKAVLDGFASLAFASTLGIGVMFSSLIILVYQGGISLLAAQLQSIISTPMMNEMTATGGVLLIGIAISSLLEIKPIRVGNFLPALAIAPIIVAILAALGIQY